MSAKKKSSGGSLREERPGQVFDKDGNEVLISINCQHCGRYLQLRAFGLRKMANGEIRNQPWCIECR